MSNAQVAAIDAMRHLQEALKHASRGETNIVRAELAIANGFPMEAWHYLESALEEADATRTCAGFALSAGANNSRDVPFETPNDAYEAADAVEYSAKTIAKQLEKK
jgi:hypothetical protein